MLIEKEKDIWLYIHIYIKGKGLRQEKIRRMRRTYSIGLRAWFQCHCNSGTYQSLSLNFHFINFPPTLASNNIK